MMCILIEVVNINDVMKILILMINISNDDDY